MKFTVLKGSSVAEGTSLQSEFEGPYSELVKLFGAPERFKSGDKVDARWVLEYEDGTIATIYNYKSGRNYNGPDAPPVKSIRDWHIGGNDRRAVQRVAETLGIPTPLTWDQKMLSIFDEYQRGSSSEK